MCVPCTELTSCNFLTLSFTLVNFANSLLIVFEFCNNKGVNYTTQAEYHCHAKTIQSNSPTVVVVGRNERVTHILTAQSLLYVNAHNTQYNSRMSSQIT